jgi:hypothetical protein
MAKNIRNIQSWGEQTRFYLGHEQNCDFKIPEILLILQIGSSFEINYFKTLLDLQFQSSPAHST